MEKKQYISPKTTLCLVQSEGIMYTTSVDIGNSFGDPAGAKQQNGFFSFDEYSADDAEAVYPQAKSAWDVDEQYDQW